MTQQILAGIGVSAAGPGPSPPGPRPGDVVGIQSDNTNWGGIVLSQEISLADASFDMYFGHRRALSTSQFFVFSDVGSFSAFSIQVRPEDNDFRVWTGAGLLAFTGLTLNQERYEYRLTFDGVDTWRLFIDEAEVATSPQTNGFGGGDIGILNAAAGLAASRGTLYHFQVASASLTYRFFIDEGSGSTTSNEAGDTSAITGTAAGAEGVDYFWVNA